MYENIPHIAEYPSTCIWRCSGHTHPVLLLEVLQRIRHHNYKTMHTPNLYFSEVNCYV